MGGCCTHEARWFSVRLNRRNAPWAFVKGEPFRVIASLELVAVLVAVMTFGQGGRWVPQTRAAVVADHYGQPRKLPCAGKVHGKHLPTVGSVDGAVGTARPDGHAPAAGMGAARIVKLTRSPTNVSQISTRLVVWKCSSTSCRSQSWTVLCRQLRSWMLT